MHFYSNDNRYGVSVFLRWLEMPLTYRPRRCLLVCFLVKSANYLSVAYVTVITDNRH